MLRRILILIPAVCILAALSDVVVYCATTLLDEDKQDQERRYQQLLPTQRSASVEPLPTYIPPKDLTDVYLEWSGCADISTCRRIPTVYVRKVLMHTEGLEYSITAKTRTTPKMAEWLCEDVAYKLAYARDTSNRLRTTVWSEDMTQILAHTNENGICRVYE